MSTVHTNKISYFTVLTKTSTNKYLAIVTLKVTRFQHAYWKRSLY